MFECCNDKKDKCDCKCKCKCQNKCECQKDNKWNKDCGICESICDLIEHCCKEV